METGQIVTCSRTRSTKVNESIILKVKNDLQQLIQPEAQLVGLSSRTGEVRQFVCAGQFGRWAACAFAC